MEALFLLHAKHRLSAFKKAKSEIVPVPKVIEEVVVPFKSDNIRIGVLNIDHLSSKKVSLIKNLILNYDVFFLIEPWGYSPDMIGYRKYTSISCYLNVLYVRSSIKHDIEDIDFGFRLQIETPLYFYYIPPGTTRQTVNLPEAPIFGDFNWKSNRFPEPNMYESSLRKRTGTGTYSNYDVQFSHVELTDHQLMSAIIKQSTKPAMKVDTNVSVKMLNEAKRTGVFKPAMKQVDKKIFDAWDGLKKRIFRRKSKIVDASIFDRCKLDFWFELLKHDENKQDMEFESDINLKNITRNRTNALDTQGLNVNIIREVWKEWNKKEKQNLLKALGRNNNINGLLLKKKEFSQDKFNIKDVRIICILPTYLKLLETTIKFDNLEKNLEPNFIGFRKGMSVEKLINYLSATRN